MPTFPHALLVISDVDGALLDHHTYRWEAAQIWLDRLRTRNIPLVFCSSKTAAEIHVLQEEMGLEGSPYIAENGAVVNIMLAQGKTQRYTAGWDYHRLCEWLHQLRQREGYHFTGFSDATPQQVADWTGLPVTSARLAMQREATEALIWRDSDQRFIHFRDRLAIEGLHIIEGGRFWHVMATEANKGHAWVWMQQHYAADGKAFTTIGLRDGPNDIPLLERVDYAVVIKGHSKTPVMLTRPDRERVYYATSAGPQGWSEGLTHFMS